MNWFYLIIAGLLEIVWAVGLKASDGFSKPLLSIGTVFTMIVSFSLLSYALKSLPVGTAYAVWTGIGAAGTAIMGMIYFGEPVSLYRIFFISIIVVGIIGLRLWS